jgi:hypothetical protein
MKYLKRGFIGSDSLQIADSRSVHLKFMDPEHTEKHKNSGKIVSFIDPQTRNFILSRPGTGELVGFRSTGQLVCVGWRGREGSAEKTGSY